MGNKLFLYRVLAALIVGILSILAFAGIFYPVKFFDFQFAPLLQRLIVNGSVAVAFLFLSLVLVTLLFGRVYCSVLCPLGLFQEILMAVFRRKNKVRKNRGYKYFLAALVWGALAGGTVVLLRQIDPYTLFGAAASGAGVGVSAALILGVLVWFKGRYFCTNICPVGAVLGLVARFSPFKIYLQKDTCVSCGLCSAKCPTGSIDFRNKAVDNETCVKCFRCVGSCPHGSLHYGLKPAPEVPFNPGRRQLLIGGAVVATFILAAKSGIKLSQKAAQKIKKVILPAGAGSPESFANRCLNCNLCVENCPMKIIKKANGNYPAVHLDYSENFCDYDCNRCSQVCPSGAIKRLSLPEKQNTRIGLSIIDADKCIKCGLCVMKCPKEAIDKVGNGFPQVLADRCIGCGVCQNACPVKAITVQAVARQEKL